jgi:hypothetical protein
MLKSKLVEIVRFFETKDFRLFGDFISSPYFNKNEELILFYEKLKKLGPGFTNKKLERQNFYKLMFPKKKYNEKHLGYLMSDIIKLLDKYLAQKAYDSNPIEAYLHNLEVYLNWGMEKNYNGILRAAENEQKKYPYKDISYYYFQYRIASVSNKYFEKQNKRAFDHHLQTAADNFDNYFLVQKLKYSCEIINRKSILSAKYELKFINEVISYLKANPPKNIPAIGIYSEILLMLLYPENKRHFFKLNLLLHKNGHLFPEKETKDMYTFALNHCIKRINMGYTEYNRELFELYKILINKNLIYSNGVLSPWIYKNIASVALRLKAFKWTEIFIEKYKEKVDENYRDSAYAYNNAYLNFSQGKYKEALWGLHDVEFSDIFFHLDTKTMQLKIYYELYEIDPLLSLLDAFKVYLKRNKLISNYMKTSYRNLIKYTQKALRIADGDKDKWKVLHASVKEVKHIASYTWLIEQIEAKIK